MVRAQIQRVLQPRDDTVVLECYQRADFRLLVSWNAVCARAHLARRKFPAPKELPNFCAALRKYVQGGRVTSVRQDGFDRILKIAVSTAEGDFEIVAELMGKHSNVVLLGENDRILACAKPVARSQSSRPLYVGAVYSPPPLPPKPSLAKAAPGDDLAKFEGVSPFLKSLVAAGLDLAKVQALDFAPVDSPGYGPYPFDVSLLNYPTVPTADFCTCLEAEYEARIESDTLESGRQALATQLQRVGLARERALADLDEAIATAHDAPRLQRLAELILAYQGQIKPGDETLDAYGYDGEPVTVKLNPEKTPVENANRYFDKAKHAKLRLTELAAQRVRIAVELAEIQRYMGRLEAAVLAEDVDVLRQECDRQHWLHRRVQSTAKEDRPFEGHAVRQVVSPGGWTVLYGTNATSNDYLTTKVAKGNDYWFHVRGQNSAHVVLVTQGQPLKVQTADMVFAAVVSARNSPAKHSSHVPVDYTLKKHVRKPRGSAPGAAVYEREKTLHVDP